MQKTLENSKGIFVVELNFQLWINYVRQSPTFWFQLAQLRMKHCFLFGAQQSWQAVDETLHGNLERCEIRVVHQAAQSVHLQIGLGDLTLKNTF